MKMKFELEQFHRNTPPEDLIKDLIEVSKKLKKNSVTMEEYNQHGKYSSSTLTRNFGSWFNVLAKANLEDSRSRINNSEEDLFKNIENLWINFGRQPKYDEVKLPVSKFSVSTYSKRFGSWRKALEKFVQYINNDSDLSDTEIDSTSNKDQIKDSTNHPIIHKTKREISDRLRFKILLRDGFTCRKCGRSPIKEVGVELHVDHILPWSKGGETVPENLEAKCKKCNLGKGNAFNA